MPRISPLEMEQTSTQQQEFFALIESVMGYVPNSFKTMARWPELLTAVSGLTGAMSTATISADLRQLIAYAVSNAAGCRYCQAHTSHGAVKIGVSAEKLHAIFEYQQNDLFSAAEKAAIKVAFGAGQNPNTTTDQDFDELKKHYSEREIVEIVAVISMFGWFNRWNDTMATELEQVPTKFAQDTLTGTGWDIGKHQ